MKIRLGILLTLCFMFTLPIMGTTEATNGFFGYNEAIERLNNISLTDADELDLISKSLAAVGSRYFAQQYKMVADALLALARNEEARFREFEIGLKMLSANKAFTDDYLSHDSLAFLPFNSLLQYIEARKFEVEGKSQEAYSIYAQVQVLDSLERAFSIIFDKVTVVDAEEDAADNAAEEAAVTENTGNGFTFVKKTDGTLTVTGYTGRVLNLIIPGNIEGNKVTAIGDDAFSSSNYVSITIPDTITSIGRFAFSWCSGIDKIEIPAGVNTIEYGAFSSCDKLQHIRIPESVTTINERAFTDCANLKDVYIPESVQYIGEGAFSACESLVGIQVSPDNQRYKSIQGVLYDQVDSMLVTYPAGREATSYQILDGTRSIGYDAFRYCNKLVSINMPDSVRSAGEGLFFECNNLQIATISKSLDIIGNFMFAYCDSLTDVIIPDNVTSIGEYAFNDCKNLKNIIIPAGVVYIEGGALSSCDTLMSIDVAPGNTVYKSIDGILFDQNMLHTYPAGKLNETYGVPFGTEKIGSYAFEGCNNLRTITIPDTVSEVRLAAFWQCEQLERADLPSKIRNIENYTYAYCSNLKKAVIPESVNTIGFMAFYGCSVLESLLIPKYVTTIDDEAFEYCDKLTLELFEESYAKQYAEDNGIPYMIISRGG